MQASGEKPKDRAAAGAGPAAPLRLWRFAALFVVLILLGFGLLTAPFAEPAATAFSRALVGTSAVLIDVCGGRAIVDGAVLTAPGNGFAIVMKNGCNGAHVMILLWAAVLAFPASWKQKAMGLMAGGAAIHVVNLGRFISLFYLGQYNRDWFDFAHYYLWESLIVLDALVIFWLWVHRVFRSGARPHASR